MRADGWVVAKINDFLWAVYAEDQRRYAGATVFLLGRRVPLAVSSSMLAWVVSRFAELNPLSIGIPEGALGAFASPFAALRAYAEWAALSEAAERLGAPRAPYALQDAPEAIALKLVFPA